MSQKILTRRGFTLGTASSIGNYSNLSELSRWHDGLPILLAGQCVENLKINHDNIKQTEKLVRAVLADKACDDVLATAPYHERLEPKFISLGSSFNEGDPQEIEMVMFDAMSGDDIIAEDLWLKASWLSFYEDDVSLRFRFSFGIDLEQDVASDPERQALASELSDAVFPESAIITDDSDLHEKLEEILEGKKVGFVERIIYFNGPSGGAYLHHDLERGHAGVVYAQLTGKTFWLALPKQRLIEEIVAFSKSHPWPDSLTLEMRREMSDLVGDRAYLAEQLDSFSNTSLIHLINETEAFVQFLIARGHGIELSPGDSLLLPQSDEKRCCWHSVFCLGEEMGQALSFAIRAD